MKYKGTKKEGGGLNGNQAKKPATSCDDVEKNHTPNQKKKIKQLELWFPTRNARRGNGVFWGLGSFRKSNWGVKTHKRHAKGGGYSVTEILKLGSKEKPFNPGNEQMKKIRKKSTRSKTDGKEGFEMKEKKHSNWVTKPQK